MWGRQGAGGWGGRGGGAHKRSGKEEEGWAEGNAGALGCLQQCGWIHRA